MKTKDYKNLLWLTLIGIIIILIIGFNKVYGSHIDWIDQHAVFPEYFRLLFYKTHNLFPNFSFNIGSGQNIFNLAYYGLFSPYVLLSYLFPFIKMVSYMQIINILIVFISTFSIYKWLNINKFSSKTCFLSALIFMLAAPIILHSHKHIMFVSYLPFLILSLIGADKYFKTNKSYLLIISIFLMILSNYYFSVCGLVVIFIYGIFKCLGINKKFIFKEFILYMLKFGLLMLVGVLLSSFLLLPVMHTLINPGREKTIIDISSLFIPNFNILNILYSPFSIGVSAISILALIYSFLTNKRNYIFLGIIISLFVFVPIFMFVLNGGLYIRAKALIPFLPLVILLIAKFIQDILNKKINIKNFIISVIVINLVILLSSLSKINIYTLAYLLDLIISCILIGLFYNKKSINIYFIFTILVSLVCVFIVNKSDKLVDKNEYNMCYSYVKDKLITSVLNNDNSFYRFNNYDDLCSINRIYDSSYYQDSIYSSTYNKYFDNSIHNDFNNAFVYRNYLMNSQVDNIMLNTYMSVKYIVSNKNVPAFYDKVKSDNGYSLYKNNNVLSLGYVNSNNLNIKDFNKLSFPYKSEALLNYAISNKKTSNYKSNMKKEKLNYKIKSSNVFSINKNNNKYIIKSKENGYIKLNLNNNYNNKILFINFDLKKDQDCSKGDLSININGTLNKLTCKQWMYKNKNKTFHYTINGNDKLLNIIFSNGTFIIDNIKVYTLDYNNIINFVNKVSSLTNINIKDNGLEGKIKNNKDGYFVFTIPYDKGFDIRVDDKKIKYENINNGYIGFYLKKGNYKINLKYNAPWFREGKMISLIGLFILMGLIIYEKKRY